MRSQHSLMSGLRSLHAVEDARIQGVGAHGTGVINGRPRLTPEVQDLLDAAGEAAP